MHSPRNLDDLYLPWLYSQVDTVKIGKSPATYWELLKQMHSMEFTWFVPNDDNRAVEGKDLRYEWAELAGIELDSDWTGLACSFLEMLIGLSRRLEFQTEAAASNWFWRLIGNLGFAEYHDQSNYSKSFVTARLRKVMDRRYDADGTGGLFPMPKTNTDQRKVELWYQLTEYLLWNE